MCLDVVYCFHAVDRSLFVVVAPIYTARYKLGRYLLAQLSPRFEPTNKVANNGQKELGQLIEVSRL